LNIFLGFIFFCIILKWSPWGNRLLLPFFIFLSPVVGYFLVKFFSLKLNIIISFVLLLNSLPYLLLNQTRPLIASLQTHKQLNISFKPPPYLKKKREELYFTFYPPAYDNFKKIIDLIEKKRCKLIAIDASLSNENGWEYPIWVMTKNHKDNFYPKIFYLNVKNRSNLIINKNIEKEPCIQLTLNYDNIQIK